MTAQSEHPAGSVAETRVAYRTVMIAGQDIFYCEAGPKDGNVVLSPTASQLVRTCSAT